MITYQQLWSLIEQGSFFFLLLAFIYHRLRFNYIRKWIIGDLSSFRDTIEMSREFYWKNQQQVDQLLKSNQELIKAHKPKKK